LGGCPEEINAETIISADDRLFLFATIREAWDYRDLFRAFLTRDLKVRYRQSFLGAAWVVLQPLLTGGLLAAALNALGVLGDLGGRGRLLFLLAGTVPWTSFASGVNAATSSVEGNAQLFRKIYFPRLLLPLAYVTGTALDFIIAVIALALIAVALSMPVTGMVAIAPALMAIQFATAAGLGLAFAALNVQYRDVKHAVPFLLQLGFLVTVLVPFERWPATIRALLQASPMTAVTRTFRGALAGTPISLMSLLVPAATAIVIFLVGCVFFEWRQRQIADFL